MPPLTLKGIVTKVGFMNKTATVTVARLAPHPKTGKVVERSKKYLVHDEANQLQHEDRVLIQNCRPISARKRFKLLRTTASPETLREIARQRAAVEAKAPADTPLA